MLELVASIEPSGCADSRSGWMNLSMRLKSDGAAPLEVSNTKTPAYPASRLHPAAPN